MNTEKENYCLNASDTTEVKAAQQDVIADIAAEAAGNAQSAEPAVSQAEEQEPDAAEKRLKIRNLNDRLRSHGHGGIWLTTQGIASLPSDQIRAVLKGVQSFSDFNPDNDPHGEHDFGSIKLEGTTFFWKIDCYDRTRTFHSPDPSNPKVTVRVLTVMMASEY